MKKIVSLALLIIMSLAFISCSTEGEYTAVTPSTTVSIPPTTLTPDSVLSGTPIPSVTPDLNSHSNDPGMSEEELGVFPVGQYSISIPNVGYVTYENYDDSVALSVSKNDVGSRYAIVFQTTDKDRPSYVICPGDDVYRVIGLEDTTYIYTSRDEEYIAASNYRSLYTNINGINKRTEDSNFTMRWYFEKNSDNTYKIAMYNNTDLTYDRLCKYYLNYEEGKLKLRKEEDGASTNFNIELTDRSTNQFLQYISYGGKIALRLPPDQKKKMVITNDKKKTALTDERAQKLSNDLELAYWYFYDLTGYIPYDNIIVKAYANTTYMAYVISGYNTITASYSKTANDFGPAQTWFSNDISKLVGRGNENDWNFGLLHEMGHMFDMNQGWKFESECQTDFKLCYVLYRGNAVAAPSECLQSQFYGYDNIEDIFLTLAGGKDWGTKEASADNYNIYGHAYRLIMIQKQIGSWDPIVKLFHWYKETELLDPSNPNYVEIPTGYSDNYKRFELFIQKMSEFSGIDCKAMYDENEYNIVMAQCGYKAK